jgi:hypothetical protein
MGKDHRKGKAVSQAQRLAFGMGVLTAPREARLVSDYWSPTDEARHAGDVRKRIEDIREAREAGLSLEEYLAL